MNETKKCTRCGEIKPLNGFGKTSKNNDGKSSCCKICSRTYMRVWVKENKDHVKKYAKNYNEENIEKTRIHNKNIFKKIKRKYIERGKYMIR